MTPVPSLTSPPLWHSKPVAGVLCGLSTTRARHPATAGCPAGENPCDYLAQVAEEDFQAAWETLVATNPLLAITWRVCDHPCESACNRGRFDAAIAIHNVERLLGDEAIRAGGAIPYRRSSPMRRRR